ncbi:MAG: gluconate 2-dehydrogenase subunit 3 family protein [Burkholderiaceae bacterium]|nr:gluconate 2-dehydrogenase subunit 3 family protein [Burkholderiaceae bacterium]
MNPPDRKPASGAAVPVGQADSDPIAGGHPWSVAQRATMARLVDLMIPASADGRMPAASMLGLYDDLAGLPADAIDTLGQGLEQLDANARAAHGQGFAALDAAAALALAEAIRAEAPRFANLFTMHTAARYYQHDRVLPLIGLEPRPPWPQGNVVKDGDWGLLEPVRRRAKFYREV